jgi:hypothetical protein
VLGIVGADEDDGPLEARVPNAWHGDEQPA